MSDPRVKLLSDVDREDVPSHGTFAVVELDDGIRFVRDYYFTDSGWLTVDGWDDTRDRYPPHRVQKVRDLETSHVEIAENYSVRTLDDPELLRIALELAGLKPEESADQPELIA